MSKPAHKNTEHPPGQLRWTDVDKSTNGQIVNSVDVDPHYQFAKAQYENDLDLRPRKLGDIIDRVKRQEEMVEKKKLTFEEWVVANKDTPNHPVTYFNLYNVGRGDMDQETFFFFGEVWKAAQEKKKMTFEEWWQKEDPPGDQEYWCRVAWKAGQENK